METPADTAAEPKSPKDGTPFHRSDKSYGRLMRVVVLSTTFVSLGPLLLMTVINYHQYNRATSNNAKEVLRRMASNNRRALEFFLEERIAALTYIVHDTPVEELRKDDQLVRILRNMNQSLRLSAFTDLGLIDASGRQLSYHGPHQLSGKDYSDQEWFHKVLQRRVYVSDVFLGYRKSPHFVIAILHEQKDEESYVLRATINTQILNEQILTAGLGPDSDCFLINPKGVLQTPSRYHGDILTPCPLKVPPRAQEAEVLEYSNQEGHPGMIAYAYIQDSPFVLLLVKPYSDILGEWFSLRTELILLLFVSAALILVVILWGANVFISRLKEADQRRAALLHRAEYSNKLASIGRLAAGVAHEINNPLAIVNEKAGLLKDIFTLTEGSLPREKTLALTESILKAVDRCSVITHRLLGFAKHMDVQNETIDLRTLIKELLSFLEKEIAHRNLETVIDVAQDVPSIESDRGQIQQVLLNLINNAFAAVSDGGKVEITVRRKAPKHVEISILDNGVGIPREHLGKIFEPFFTTKKGYGTGLGLSVTYGIVQKLGGEIGVESEAGQWTRFTVSLPISRD